MTDLNESKKCTRKLVEKYEKEQIKRNPSYVLCSLEEQSIGGPVLGVKGRKAFSVTLKMF